jgi:hypothetical protein
MGAWKLLANSADAAHSQSMFDPASPGAESIRHLSLLVLAITGIIFLIVEGVLCYSSPPAASCKPVPV